MLSPCHAAGVQSPPAGKGPPAVQPRANKMQSAVRDIAVLQGKLDGFPLVTYQVDLNAFFKDFDRAFLQNKQPSGPQAGGGEFAEPPCSG